MYVCGVAEHTRIVSAHSSTVLTPGRCLDGAAQALQLPQGDLHPQLGH